MDSLTIADLPDDLLQYIILFLPVEHVVKASEISKLWLKCARDSQLWRTLYLQRFDAPSEEPLHWMEQYKEDSRTSLVTFKHSVKSLFMYCVGWVKFDPKSVERSDFEYEEGAYVKLKGMGPKLVYSYPRRGNSLKWRFQVSGNMIMDYGVLAGSVKSDDRALYESSQAEADLVRMGAHETGTAGGNLSHRITVVNNSVGMCIC